MSADLSSTTACEHVSVFAPDVVIVAPRHLQVGAEWVASFAVTGYPREVHPGWLQPLLTYPGRVDVSLHIEPIDPVAAANRLKRQLARLESGRRYSQDKGRLLDPHVEAATEDAYDLAARVARGEGKLYRFGLYLTVHAGAQDELADEVAAVRSLAASLLLDAKPATYRSLQGWITCLPMGLDLLKMRRTFDTSALAAAFPFTSPDLPSSDPVSATAPFGGAGRHLPVRSPPRIPRRDDLAPALADGGPASAADPDDLFRGDATVVGGHLPECARERDPEAIL